MSSPGGRRGQLQFRARRWWRRSCASGCWPAPTGGCSTMLLPENTFAVHPYHRPAIGSIEDLDAATLDDVQAFHATYYRPDDATLVVVGNFDQAQLDGWIDAVSRRAEDTRRRRCPQVTAVEPPRTGPKTVTAYAPNVPLPAVAITWLAPEGARPRRAGAAGAGRDPDRRQVVARLRQPGLREADRRPGAVQRRPARPARASTTSAPSSRPATRRTRRETALRAQVAALRDQPVSAAGAGDRQDPAGHPGAPPARDHRRPRQRAGRRAGDRRRRRRAPTRDLAALAGGHRRRRAARGAEVSRRRPARGDPLPARQPKPAGDRRRRPPRRRRRRSKPARRRRSPPWPRRASARRRRRSGRSRPADPALARRAHPAQRPARDRRQEHRPAAGQPPSLDRARPAPRPTRRGSPATPT